MLKWNYLVELLQVTQYIKDKMVSFSIMSSKHLSTTKVKCKRTCLILWVEETMALHRLIASFGIFAVVGIQKKPLSVYKR